jgi:hypothetical protein
MKVVRAGLNAYEDHLDPIARQLFGLIRREHDDACGPAR